MTDDVDRRIATPRSRVDRGIGIRRSIASGAFGSVGAVRRPEGLSNTDRSPTGSGGRR